MPPAKENDAVTFPSTLSPPSSTCPPTLKPLSSMYRLPLTIVPSNYNIQVSQAYVDFEGNLHENACFRSLLTFPTVSIEAT